MDCLSAIREGNLDRVKEITKFCALSHNVSLSEGYILLCRAIEYHRPAIANYFLTNGCEVNSVTYRFTTALHLAVTKRFTEIVDLLLSRGANIDAKDQLGRTPLHLAVKKRCTKIVEHLLINGANVEAKDHLGKTPLHLSVKVRCTKITELLLTNGANIETKDNFGKTPLHYMTVKLLINHDANLNAKDEDGQTPLFYFVKNKNLNLLKVFLTKSANIKVEDTNGETALHFSVRNEVVEIIELLLKSGANVDVKNFIGVTPLHIATEKGNLEIVKLLLSANAVIDVVTSDNSTPLYYAVKNGHTDVANLLLKHGANVDISPTDGKTVLYIASKEGCAEMVEHILKCCPDIYNKSNRDSLYVAVCAKYYRYNQIVLSLLRYGFTIDPDYISDSDLLHNSAAKGYLTILEDLLKYGADVNTLDNEKKCYTILHAATAHMQEETTKLLINHGANLNAKDENGQTALFYLVENYDLKMLKRFLVNGVNVNAKDVNGLTALGYAIMLGEKAMVKMLLEHKANINIVGKNFICSALQLAVEGRELGISKMLISKGAKVTSSLNLGSCGENSFHVAARNGSLKIMKLLLNFGADIDSKSRNGNTALHYASEADKYRAVEFLLEHGASINVKNNRTFSPLHVAKPSTEKILIKHIIKMQMANLRIDISYSYPLSTINIHYRQVCKEELEIMKTNKIIDSNVSFYDVLRKHVHQVAMYMSNEKLAQAFKSNEYESKFPIYANMIKCQIQRGMERRKLMDKGRISFNVLCINLIELPYNCVEKILNNLSDEDLKMLINV